MSGASIETTLELWASSLPDVKGGCDRCSRRSEWRDPRSIDGLLGEDPMGASDGRGVSFGLFARTEGDPDETPDGRSSVRDRRSRLR